MEQAAWSPPIPSGRAARTEWKRLDPGVRSALLRGEPAPDPVTAVIALGYARTILRRGPWSAVGQRLVIVFVFICCGAVVGLYVRNTAINVFIYVVLIVALYATLIQQRRARLKFVRIEAMTAPHLLTAERPPPVPTAMSSAVPAGSAAQGTPLVVSIDRRKATSASARVLVFIVVLAAIEFVIPSAITRTLGGVLLALAALIAIGVIRRRRSPVLFATDSEGVTFPRLHTRVTWAEVTEARILPQRSRRAGGSNDLVVAFMTTDPGRIVAALRGRRYWAWRLNARYYGTPLAISDRLLDHRAEQIAAALPVPVRRFTD